MSGTAVEPPSPAEDSLFALELALEACAQQRPLSPVERAVLAVCALCRECNGGGYDAFLHNASRVHAPLVVDALRRIGCHELATIAADALAAVQREPPLDALALRRALTACDERQECSTDDPVAALRAWMAGYADAILTP